MEKDVLKELNMNNREEVIVFLKKLWREEQTACPKCGNLLEFMHKKAKKNNCDWKCSKCNSVYKTIDILYKLNEKDK